jgi:hypothetical protein
VWRVVIDMSLHYKCGNGVDFDLISGKFNVEYLNYEVFHKSKSTATGTGRYVKVEIYTIRK